MLGCLHDADASPNDSTTYKIAAEMAALRDWVAMRAMAEAQGKLPDLCSAIENEFRRSLGLALGVPTTPSTGTGTITKPLTPIKRITRDNWKSDEGSDHDEKPGCITLCAGGQAGG